MQTTSEIRILKTKIFHANEQDKNNLKVLTILTDYK